MNADELLWHQINSIHEYLRLIGAQGVNWYVFSLGADAAALWAILSDTVSLKTRVAPYMLAFFNFLGAAFCFAMPFYLCNAAGHIESLTRQLSPRVVAHGCECKAGDSIPCVTATPTRPASRLLLKHPAFSPTLWSVVSGAMCTVLLVVTVLWIIYNRDGYLINRKKEDPKPHGAPTQARGNGASEPAPPTTGAPT